MRSVDQILKSNIKAARTAQKFSPNGSPIPPGDNTTEIARDELNRFVSLEQIDTSHEQVQAAVKRAYEWIELKRAGYDPSFILSGPNGTGKTTVALGMAWSRHLTVDIDWVSGLTPEQRQKAKDAGILSVPSMPSGICLLEADLFLMLHEASQTTGVNTMLNGMLANRVSGRALCLVVDDVGMDWSVPMTAKDNQAAAKAGLWTRLVNYCYEATPAVSLVITTNLTKVQLGRHVGVRAWDRLSEMAPNNFFRSFSKVETWRRPLGGR